MLNIKRITTIVVISSLFIVSGVSGKPLRTSLSGKERPAGAHLMADVERYNQEIPRTNPDYFGIKSSGGNPSDAVLLSNPYEESVHVLRVGPYLQKSKAVQDILALRKTARTVKLQTVREKFKKNSRGQLTQTQKRILDFLTRQVDRPMLMLNAMPFKCSSFMEGPCCFQMPAYFQTTYGSDEGAWADTSFICALGFENMEPPMTIEEEIESGIFELIICHEIGHGIMMDMMDKEFTKIESLGAGSHSTEAITEVGTGYTEGWAEAFEGVYGPENPNLNPKIAASLKIPDFLLTRQDALRRDRYIWVTTSKKTGEVKNGLQMMSTEGVVAGIFYDILTSKAIAAPYEKCITVMVKTKPMSFMQFANDFLKLFPEDKKVITRIILETTFYGTMSQEATIRYKHMFQTRQAFFNKKVPQEAYAKARQEFTSFKESLFLQAMSGDNIFANVGPSLWIRGTNEEDGECIRNLNTATENMLIEFGLEPQHAAQVVAARNEKSFFTGDPVEKISSIIGVKGMKAFQDKGLKMTTYDPGKPLPVVSEYVSKIKDKKHSMFLQQLPKGCVMVR